MSWIHLIITLFGLIGKNKARRKVQSSNLAPSHKSFTTNLEGEVE